MVYSEWNSVADYLIDNLIAIIKSGNYKQGDRFLTEREICKNYNVGRSSAREAIRVLCSAGYLKTIRGNGTFIDNLLESDSLGLMHEYYDGNKDKLCHLIEVRSFIEVPAITKLAKIATAEDIETLDAIYSTMQERLNEHNVLATAILDEKFHLLLVDCLGNPILSSYNRSIQKLISDFRSRTYRNDDFFYRSAREHKEMIDCIRTHDSKKASEIMTNHIKSIQHYYKNDF